jgi:hypothetical protein
MPLPLVACSMRPPDSLGPSPIVKITMAFTNPQYSGRHTGGPPGLWLLPSETVRRLTKANHLAGSHRFECDSDGVIPARIINEYGPDGTARQSVPQAGPNSVIHPNSQPRLRAASAFSSVSVPRSMVRGMSFLTSCRITIHSRLSFNERRNVPDQHATSVETPRLFGALWRTRGIGRASSKTIRRRCSASNSPM